MIRLIIALIIFSSCSNNIDKLEETKIMHNSSIRTFYTYEPLNLEKNMTLVVGLHGYTGNANTFIRNGNANFNKFLESRSFIGAYPEGKSFNEGLRFFSSWNDLAGSVGKGPKGDICDIDRDYYPYPPDCKNPHRCSWASCDDDLGFIEKVIDHHKGKYDIKKVIVIGMSNGGMLAQSIGCNLGDKVDGIINISGMQALGMSCVPKKPVSMVIYGALNDFTVPPVDIVASDGYFYEPMKNTVLAWKGTLNCKNSSFIEKEIPTKISIEKFTDCENNKTITSILDHKNNHDWPKPYKWGIELLFEPLIN